MPEITFNRAAALGSGMMGPGIALTFALGGTRSTIVSRTPEGAAHGLEKARAQARLLAENGLVDAATERHALELLDSSSDFDGTVAAADLVLESGPEDLPFKQELFARLDRVAPAHAVLASNTSGLSITAIAERCTRPERVLTSHFWNPPHLMPLVEIVRGGKTDPAVAESLRDFLAACGKTPVIVRQDRPGQLGNRLQMALVREAVNIVAEGIADAADVDTVVRNGFGLRMPAYGIFEHMDLVGLDLAISVLEYVAKDLYNEPRAPEYMRELLRRGESGARAGKGFYDWSQKSADGVKARRDAFLVAALQYRRRTKERAAGADE
jgi:3-hydroxyacyl-CoA dehydrogenase